MTSIFSQMLIHFIFELETNGEQPQPEQQVTVQQPKQEEHDLDTVQKPEPNQHELETVLEQTPNLKGGNWERFVYNSFHL